MRHLRLLVFLSVLVVASSVLPERIEGAPRVLAQSACEAPPDPLQAEQADTDALDPCTSPAVASTQPGASASPDARATAGERCPAALHASQTTVGPDGKPYLTWHPPVDPESGCLYGHEHGADPRTSRANPTMPAFGYAAAQIGVTEPHEGYKVFIQAGGAIEQGDRRQRTVPADYRIVFHMGTSGVKRYTERFHSLEYDYLARDTSGRALHLVGMADTGAETGSTCDLPRRDGRDFSTIGCADSYEIWGFKFQVIDPSDPFQGVMETRASVTGAVAVFDPVLTRDTADSTRLVYTSDYRGDPLYRARIDPRSPDAFYQGCRREAYFGPNFWNNAAGPTVYYTDGFGRVQPGAGPGRLRQEVSGSASLFGEQFKFRQDFCGNGISPPN